ncbi:MAG: Cof-type HAD-IIB family hydrolase [Lachnospiraceae bacterium]
MDKKMIFLDLDGTLLDDEKKLPEANRQAITEALEAGHIVLICTGRPLCSAKKQIPRLGLDRPGCYAITYNGGLIWDSYKEEIVYKKTLPIDQVAYVFEKAREWKLHAQTYTEDGFICEQDNQEGRDYEKFTQVDRKIVKDVIVELNGQEPCKVLTIAKKGERAYSEAFRRELEPWGRDKVNMAFSNAQYMEITPAGISKGNAIPYMAKFLGIPVENTIAVGDAENDITMIQAAGLGAVMKNASDEIKEYADYVTEKTNNEGGVAEVIRKFMLDKSCEA